MPSAAPPFRYLLACAIALAFLAGGRTAAAADAASGAAPSLPEGAASPPALAYRAIVDAPPPLKEILSRDVGLVRWQGYAYMSDELLDVLLREAADEARNAAAVEGYFSPAITIEVDRKADPATVTLKVVPGEPTRITAVRISVAGPATTDAPLGTDAIATLTRDWGLAQDAVFRQAAWTAAKASAVATLTASPYAAARITHSEALIDPDRRSAELTIDIDSGPPFRFGDARHHRPRQVSAVAGPQLRHAAPGRALPRAPSSTASSGASTRRATSPARRRSSIRTPSIRTTRPSGSR